MPAWSDWEMPAATLVDFKLPPELEASEPPEVRGLSRDAVRLMVSQFCHESILHTAFSSLPEFLRAGDVLVVNTSGTLNAALHAIRSDGAPIELHLSTRLPGALWIVELRLPAPDGTAPFLKGKAGEILLLPGEAQVQLLLPYRADQRTPQAKGTVRLWLASFDPSLHMETYLQQYGFPIRYKYVRQEWPSEYYQTVYVTEMGSAEMPSAGRPFTTEIITRLVAQGVQIAPLLLHTGVASLEDHEPPYEEYYRVPAETANLVRAARAEGRRVIAVGTTSARAIESVTDEYGIPHGGEGWTNLVITPQRGLRAVSGLLTGLHEPRSSHLALLAALAGEKHLQKAYDAAVQHRYRWHEFGDMHLILP